MTQLQPLCIFIVLLLLCHGQIQNGAAAAAAAVGDRDISSETKNDDRGPLEHHRIVKRDGVLKAEEEIPAVSPLVASPDQSPVIRKRESKNRGKKWDHWGKWSPCSVSCGVGKITRWRHCLAGSCAPGEKEAQIKTCASPSC